MELKGKAKLVYDAFLKIEKGKKLMEEGQIELSSLVPDGKLEVLPVVASKNLRRPKINLRVTRQSPRTAEELLKIFTHELDAHPEGLTPNWFKLNYGMSSTIVNRMKDQLIKEGNIATIKSNTRGIKLVKIKLNKKS